MDEKLKALRQAIDEVDLKLVALLSERARLAQEVGRVKEATEAPVYRPDREREVLRNVGAANPGPLPGAALAAIFREVMSACRARERRIRVAFLGPAGTFSELALLKQFGSSVDVLISHIWIIPNQDNKNEGF